MGINLFFAWHKKFKTARAVRRKCFDIMAAMDDVNTWEDPKTVWAFLRLWKKLERELPLFGDCLTVHSDKEVVAEFSRKLSALLEKTPE